MVMRVWYGHVPREKADEFERYLLETGGVDIPATPGNRGAYFVRTERGSITVFGVFSIWESEDAIRAFAGPDPQRVRYYPRDGEFLIEMPSQADHYSILEPTHA
jgi:heme-degrading monooxygenase HmoA